MYRLFTKKPMERFLKTKNKIKNSDRQTYLILSEFGNLFTTVNVLLILGVSKVGGIQTTI